MEYLKKSESIFKRGEDGQLLPVDVIVEGLPGNVGIKVLPITSGKFNEIMTGEEKGSEQDNKVILEHCVLPKFTLEETRDLKPYIKAPIVNAIMAVSLGKPQKELNDKAKEVIKEEEKNLNQTLLE